MIKQNIVFVENKAGSLKRVTGLLANNNINIYGFACFDAPEFAIFRMICDNPDKAEIILNQSGYMNRITQAIVVDMKDQVGGLDELLKIMAKKGAPIKELIDAYKLSRFLDSPKDYGKPWYGQLMAGPQMIAYLLQVNYWLEKYKITLDLS